MSFFGIIKFGLTSGSILPLRTARISRALQPQAHLPGRYRRRHAYESVDRLPNLAGQEPVTAVTDNQLPRRKQRGIETMFI